MRLDINISDELYSQAQFAAAADGLSVDRYMANILKSHLRGAKTNIGALSLTAEQLEVVLSAQEDVRAGRVLTLDQAKADHEAHRNEWLARNPR